MAEGDAAVGDDVQPWPRAILPGFAPHLCTIVQAEENFAFSLSLMQTTLCSHTPRSRTAAAGLAPSHRRHVFLKDKHVTLEDLCYVNMPSSLS